MELQEIEDKLKEYDDMYVKGYIDDNTAMVDEAENGIGNVFELIEQNQFKNISVEADEILNCHGFVDDYPYNEGGWIEGLDD